MRTGEHGVSVKKACGALGVSRGGCYAFLNRPKSSRRIAREALEPFVEDVFYASNRRYGLRRIVVELRKIGIVANGKTARRMMARKGLVSCRGPRKHGRGGKASDKGANVLNREFSVQKRNSVWCGDITYIPTREGWPCLATRLDLLSRKIVGWQVSSRINENLAIDALDNAVNRENPEEGPMARTDRGSQCVSSRFCRELENRGFVQSFSPQGPPLRQRRHGVVLQDPEKGASPRSQVRHPDRGQAGNIQVHRAALQYQAAAFVPRQPIARGI